MTALRPPEISTSFADIIYKSLKSPLSSALVASRSKRACATLSSKLSGDTPYKNKQHTHKQTNEQKKFLVSPIGSAYSFSFFFLFANGERKRTSDTRSFSRLALSQRQQLQKSSAKSQAFAKRKEKKKDGRRRRRKHCGEKRNAASLSAFPSRFRCLFCLAQRKNIPPPLYLARTFLRLYVFACVCVFCTRTAPSPLPSLSRSSSLQ